MAKKKYIESPERMWELFQEYRKDIKSKPIRVHDFVGKDGDSVHRDKERPLTMEGFSNYCFENLIASNIHDYFANSRDAYNEYSSICRAIRDTIRQDQIEGGLAGIYNPSITQRLNGLVDRRETEANVNVQGITGMEIK